MTLKEQMQIQSGIITYDEIRENSNKEIKKYKGEGKTSYIYKGKNNNYTVMLFGMGKKQILKKNSLKAAEMIAKKHVGMKNNKES